MNEFDKILTRGERINKLLFNCYEIPYLKVKKGKKKTYQFLQKKLTENINEVGSHFKKM